MSASERDDWRLWFERGPDPDIEKGNDATGTSLDRQWWHRARFDDAASPRVWAVGQRMIGQSVLADALGQPSEVKDLLGSAPEHVLARFDGVADLPEGLRRLGPARDAPVADVAEAAELALVLVNGHPVIALRWEATGTRLWRSCGMAAWLARCARSPATSHGWHSRLAGRRRPPSTTTTNRQDCPSKRGPPR